MTDFMLPRDAIPGHANWQSGTVELIEIGSVSGAQAGAAPARSISVDALRQERGRRRWVGSAQALIRLVANERPPPPAGMIFHTGRCGSTLLTNMLAANPHLRILNEPDVLNGLLIHQMTAGDLGTGHAEIQTLMNAFSRGLDERRLIVKLSSWVAAAGCQILAALPAVPALFLWRPAAKVVASCLDMPPAWSGHPEVRALIDGPARREAVLDPIERAVFYAQAWNATVTGGLEMARRFRGQIRVSSYDELRKRPAEVCTQVGAWFGVPGHDAFSDAMADVSRVYSKDPAGHAAFEPAAAHARPPLNPAASAVVTRMTGPAEAAICALTALS